MLLDIFYFPLFSWEVKCKEVIEKNSMATFAGKTKLNRI